MYCNLVRVSQKTDALITMSFFFVLLCVRRLWFTWNNHTPFGNTIAVTQKPALEQFWLYFVFTFHEKMGTLETPPFFCNCVRRLQLTCTYRGLLERIYWQIKYNNKNEEKVMASSGQIWT